MSSTDEGPQRWEPADDLDRLLQSVWQGHAAACSAKDSQADIHDCPACGGTHEILDEDIYTRRKQAILTDARRRLDELLAKQRTMAIVTWTTRRAGTTTHLFSDRATAEKWAREQAREYDQHGQYREQAWQDGSLTIDYGEGDSLTVEDATVDSDSRT